MYNIDGTEIDLKYHTEDLMQQAEHERQMRQLARINNHNKSQHFGMHIKIGFIRTSTPGFGRIVIEGELK